MEWGDACVMKSPAFWAAQAWMWELEEPDHFRLGRSLEEEVMACLLGGYGIPSEVGLAAYERVRQAWHTRPSDVMDEVRLEELLSIPLPVGGRTVRYRFPAQKARYLSGALASLASLDRSLPDVALRNQLNGIRGIGPKTASWIVRNWRGSDEVAILDVHILRVGRSLGLFEQNLQVERHYARLERRFLDFAEDLRVRASILDSVIWMAMRQEDRVVRGKIGARPNGQLEMVLS